MDKFLNTCSTCRTLFIQKQNNNNTLLLGCECEAVGTARIFYGDTPIINRNKFVLHRINYWNNINYKWGWANS